MTKFLAISQNTFVQTVRQPVYTWMLLVAFAILLISQPLAAWAMGSDFRGSNQRMLEGLGLGTLLICGLIVASLSASSVLSREIEDKTALTVISKPVSRPMFVVGKFGGVGAAVMLFFYIATLVYLLTLRHKVTPAAYHDLDWPVIVLGTSGFVLALAVAVAGNVLFGWTFTSAYVYSLTATLSLATLVVGFVGIEWTLIPFGEELMRWDLLWALVMLAMALLIFVAIAIAASTRLGRVGTLLVCLALFAVGSDHTMLFGYYRNRLVLSHAAHWVCPNLGFFYAIDALTEGTPIPGHHVALLAAYGACYIAGVLAIGAVLFQRRSMEGQSGTTTMPGAVSFLAALGQVVAAGAALAGLEAALAWLVGLWSDGFEPMLSPVWTSLIAVGAAGWIFWYAFARGNRWCYWGLMVLAAAAALAAGVSVVGLWAWPGRVAGGAAWVPPALLGVLLLPRTRRHFHTVAVKTAH